MSQTVRLIRLSLSGNCVFAVRFHVQTAIIPELEKIDLTTRKGFMDFISMADKGIVTIRNETAKKALEAYAKEALKKTNLQQPSDK